MDKEAVIAHLNEILKHEWTGVAQYSQGSFIIQGPWREVNAKLYPGRQGAVWIQRSNHTGPLREPATVIPVGGKMPA